MATGYAFSEKPSAASSSTISRPARAGFSPKNGSGISIVQWGSTGEGSADLDSLPIGVFALYIAIAEQIGTESSVPSSNPQPVIATLTRTAIFLIVTIKPGPEHDVVVRTLCGDLAGLLRAVGFRALDGRLSCVMAFGSDAWDQLFGLPKPTDLHPFREIRGRHHAIATPGDILFHIRSTRMDLCFELATQIMSRLDGAVSTADEVHGFTYFDDRDLIGFVDGTENPVEQAAFDATIIGEEDAAFAGGSYVIVQKYLHDLKGWDALPIEEQERIIGRRKLSDIELDDAVKPSSAHIRL